MMAALPFVLPLTAPLVHRGAAPELSGQGGGVRPPYPSPPGYRWQYLTENGARLAENGQPLINLERVS